MYDPIYRRLFAFPRMVGELLRAVAAEWIDQVDLDTLEKLPAEHVGDRHQLRRGDAVWRVRFRNGWLYLLVLLEFQSRVDARMCLRNLEYTALLYRELDRRGELGSPGRWPPVLPVVLYNGDAPWRAALEMRDLISPAPEPLRSLQPAQRSLLLDERHMAADDLPSGNLMRTVIELEQSRSPSELARAARTLPQRLRVPRDTEIGRAFVAWMGEMVATMVPDGSAPDLGDILEETAMTTLVERVAQWPDQWRREGAAEGRREGVARERALLCRLAAVRFDDDVAREVEALLGATEDPERLSTAADLIFGAGSGPELVAAIGRLTD